MRWRGLFHANDDTADNESIHVAQHQSVDLTEHEPVDLTEHEPVGVADRFARDLRWRNADCEFDVERRHVYGQPR